MFLAQVTQTEEGPCPDVRLLSAGYALGEGGGTLVVTTFIRATRVGEEITNLRIDGEIFDEVAQLLSDTIENPHVSVFLMAGKELFWIGGHDTLGLRDTKVVEIG